MNIASAKLALYAWWARVHWQTTLAGFIAAFVVALQRTPSSNTALHWQDLVAALFLAVLGTLGVDPARLPSAAALVGAAESGNIVGLVLSWMRANWVTTVTGLAGAGMVVLQRVDDNTVHWQDGVAAVGLIALGVLAIDPGRLPAVQPAPAVPPVEPSPAPASAAPASPPVPDAAPVLPAVDPNRPNQTTTGAGAGEGAA